MSLQALGKVENGEGAVWAPVAQKQDGKPSYIES